MNTIEERAIDAAMDWTYTELDAGTIIEEHTQDEYKAYKQGFTDGAKDQQKIDIEKVCEMLEKRLTDFVILGECQGKIGILFDQDKFIEQFVRAMEE